MKKCQCQDYAELRERITRIEAYKDIEIVKLREELEAERQKNKEYFAKIQHKLKGIELFLMIVGFLTKTKKRAFATFSTIFVFSSFYFMWLDSLHAKLYLNTKVTHFLWGVLKAWNGVQ